MSKYGEISGPHFPVFGLNTERYGPEKNPYSDTFHTAYVKVKAQRISAEKITFRKNSCVELLKVNFP